MSDLNSYEEGLAVDLAKAQARIEELEAVLQEVEAWVDDVGYSTIVCVALVPVFRKVKAALGKGYT